LVDVVFIILVDNLISSLSIISIIRLKYQNR